MFEIGIKGLAAIVTRALIMFGWGFLIKKRRRGALKKFLLVTVLDPSVVVAESPYWAMFYHY